MDVSRRLTASAVELIRWYSRCLYDVVVDDEEDMLVVVVSEKEEGMLDCRRTEKDCVCVCDNMDSCSRSAR